VRRRLARRFRARRFSGESRTCRIVFILPWPSVRKGPAAQEARARMGQASPRVEGRRASRSLLVIKPFSAPGRRRRVSQHYSHEAARARLNHRNTPRFSDLGRQTTAALHRHGSTWLAKTCALERHPQEGKDLPLGSMCRIIADARGLSITRTRRAIRTEKKPDAGWCTVTFAENFWWGSTGGGEPDSTSVRPRGGPQFSSPPAAC